MIIVDNELIRCLMLSDQERTKEDNELIKQFVQQKGSDYIDRLSRDTKVIAFAAHTLSQLFPVDKRWMDIHDYYCKRNELLLETLQNVFKDTNEAGIKTMCITENFASLLCGNACIGCFQSSDIDLTADRSEQKQIEDVFSKYGFILKSDTVQVTKYKNNEIIDGGYSFQITWVAVARSYLNQDAPTKRLVDARRRATTLDSSDVKVPNPTDLLYFCAYHISAGHYYTLTPGIRLYVDIDRLVRGNRDIDWQKIFEWSAEDNIGIRVIMTVYLSHKLLKTPIPEEAISFIEESKYSNRFAKRLLNPNDLGFGCNAGRLHRLYIELASNGTSIGKALIEKIKGR